MLASILATINFNESYDVTDETSKNWTPFSILIDLINKFLFYDYFYFIWQEYHFFFTCGNKFCFIFLQNKFKQRKGGRVKKK